jgi:hypothetical protein
LRCSEPPLETSARGEGEAEEAGVATEDDAATDADAAAAVDALLRCDGNVSFSLFLKPASALRCHPSCVGWKCANTFMNTCTDTQPNGPDEGDEGDEAGGQVADREANAAAAAAEAEVDAAEEEEEEAEVGAKGDRVMPKWPVEAGEKEEDEFVAERGDIGLM